MFLVPVTRSQSALTRSLDRLFDDGFDRFFGAAEGDAALRNPSLDVSETDNGYKVVLDLPGVAKDDVKITIDGRHVSVAAQVQREETKKEGERVIYRERASSSFARSFTLPEEVDQEGSQAKLDKGVLTLSLARKRVLAARQLSVN
jgi:HSP20 family protein